LFFGGYITGTKVGTDMLEARVPNAEVMEELHACPKNIFSRDSGGSSV